MKSHTITGGDMEPDPDNVAPANGAAIHGWGRGNPPDFGAYVESGPAPVTETCDNPGHGEPARE